MCTNFTEACEPLGATGIEPVLSEWRRRAADVLMLAIAIAFTPGLLLLLGRSRDTVAGPAVLLIAVILYTAALLGAVCRGIDYRLRVSIVLCLGYVFALIGTAVRPDGPFVRMMPVPLSVIALVLLGQRAGRISAAVGVLVVLVSPFLHRIPSVAASLSGSSLAPPLSIRLILTQSVAVAASLVTVMMLLRHFHTFLIKSLGNERLATARLEQEAAELMAARCSLEQEIEKRRGLEEEISRISDDERRRLGQDLHDGVCQQITGALLRCKALQKRVERGIGIEVDDLDVLSQLLGEAIDEAHAVSRGLCPLDLGAASLESALRSLTRRTRESSGMGCLFVSTGDVSDLDHGSAQHLYRIAQEALSNAIRHSNATSIVLQLHRSKNDVVLMVDDNGLGMPSEALTEGMGLRTMAYRAQIMHGTFALQTMPAGGTRVECRIPCGPVANGLLTTDGEDGS